MPPLPEQLDLVFDTYAVRERVSAKARSIRVEVLSSREVALVIPRSASRQAARDFLRSREPWVRQKIAEFRLRETRQGQTAPPQLRWDGSDRLPLRGLDTTLHLVPAQLRTPAVRLESGQISVFCPGAWLGQTRRLERLVREALKKQALRDAEHLLREEGARLGVSYAGPRIADQKTLWGSCAPSGLISLSWRLILAPPPAFRYVVVHELCHRVHLDHSERFWALVERQYPGYEAQRRWLHEHGQRLHGYLVGQ